MNPYVQARKDIRTLAGFTRGLLALDKELGRAGDLSKVVGEMEKRVEALKAEEAKALKAKDARANVVEEAMAEARRKADEHIEGAMNEAHTVRMEATRARTEAKQAVENAYTEAAAIVEKAKARAKSTTDAAAKAAEQSRARAEEAERECAGLDEEIAARKRTLGEITAQIDAMRKRLGA